ncbi:hypothetical protein [Rhodococcus rhodochrous]|uniref:hypothetical protein n=1 Tax=Rhodococcus rhodochrous TaxID=1829 RepID=UPI00128EC692|nr:hypothetical protein [Rhodococcus rhodochrous]
MFHETLHQDSLVNAEEKLVATALQALVYGQYVLATPEVATSHATRPPSDTGAAQQIARDAGGQEALLSALRAAVSGHPRRPKPGIPGGSTTPPQLESSDHSPQAGPELELELEL